MSNDPTKIDPRLNCKIFFKNSNKLKSKILIFGQKLAFLIDFLPVWVRWWALRWELFVYTLWQLGKEHRCVLFLLSSLQSMTASELLEATLSVTEDLGLLLEPVLTPELFEFLLFCKVTAWLEFDDELEAAEAAEAALMAARGTGVNEMSLGVTLVMWSERIRTMEVIWLWFLLLEAVEAELADLGGWWWWTGWLLTEFEELSGELGGVMVCTVVWPGLEAATNCKAASGS